MVVIDDGYDEVPELHKVKHVEVNADLFEKVLNKFNFRLTEAARKVTLLMRSRKKDFYAVEEMVVQSRISFATGDVNGAMAKALEAAERFCGIMNEIAEGFVTPRHRNLPS